MQESKLKVTLNNFRNYIIATGLVSGVLVLCASYGDFQRINIYEKSSKVNDFGNFNQYVIVKEYDKSYQNTKGLTIVDSVTSGYAINKIVYALGAIITGSACLALTYEQEKSQDFRVYAEVKQVELQKKDVDTQVAAHMKIAEEKVTLEGFTLLEELMLNPIYAELKRDQIRTEEKDHGEEEPQAPKTLWDELDEDETTSPAPSNPPESVTVPSTPKKGFVTEAQIAEIVKLNRVDFIRLGDAISRVTGFSEDQPEFIEARKEITRRLTK